LRCGMTVVFDLAVAVRSEAVRAFSGPGDAWAAARCGANAAYETRARANVHRCALTRADIEGKELSPRENRVQPRLKIFFPLGP